MTALLLLLGGFFFFLTLGVPIAFAMGLGAILSVLSTNLPMVVVGQRMLVILDSFPFLALPFFVIAGLLMEKGGITKRLIDFATLFVARITGDPAARSFERAVMTRLGCDLLGKAKSRGATPRVICR